MGPSGQVPLGLGAAAHIASTSRSVIDIQQTSLEPDDKNEPRVAVVVPTYNEAENLPELASRLFALRIPNARLIIVDDGSPDGTGDVAAQLGLDTDRHVELIQRGEKLGLGTAYVAGFKRALGNADQVVQMDADLSHKPEYIPGMLQALKNADVVVGSRYVSEGGVDESWSIFRRFLSYGGNLGIRVVSGVKVRDATSGFKAFQSTALKAIDLNDLRCRGFAFQAELAHACQRKGHYVVEHPIVFDDRIRGQSKMSLGIVFEAVWRLLPLRWRRDG